MIFFLFQSMLFTPHVFSAFGAKLAILKHVDIMNVQFLEFEQLCLVDIDAEFNGLVDFDAEFNSFFSDFIVDCLNSRFPVLFHIHDFPDKG
jgi:hypothetical protein